MNLFTTSSFHGPSDDWDPQGYDDTEGENLTALGMHTSDDEKDEDELEDDKKPVVAAVAIDEEEEEVDGLRALEKLEKELKKDDLNLGGMDGEE